MSTTALDYQHSKRFPGVATATATIDSTPPRVVTPSHNHPTTGDETFSGHSRTSNPSATAPGSPMLHQPTATNGGLTYASPLRRPTEPMRYSLEKGRQPHTTQGGGGGGPPLSPSKSRRRASAEKLQAAQSLLAARNGTGSGGGGESKLRKQDPHAYKIFLLLLQPQSKIFELIQLIYSPFDTTVGNILQLIPQNATEPALGSQEYLGLCRPKTQEELLDLEQLASDARPGITTTTSSSSSSSSTTAKITLGEILVAIPQGYTGPDVAILSKQILANPKIVKLLKRADPLAPKNRHRSSSRRRSSNRRTTSSSSSNNNGGTTRRTKTRSAEQVHVLEKHDEAEEEKILSAEQKQEAERRMNEAMEHAAAEAAAANAAIPGGSGAVAGGVLDPHGSFVISRSQSIHSIGSQSLEEFSQQESLDESFSSWSKSFDESFSAQSSICSGVSKRAMRRKDRQARRMRILQRSALAAFGLMIVFYIMDPNKDNLELQRAHQAQTANPMGFMGIVQCLFLLLTLYKVERLVRTTHAAQHYQHQQQQNANANANGRGVSGMPAIYMSEQRRCPFLKASARALQKFKHRYSKRLAARPRGISGSGSGHAEPRQSLATGTLPAHPSSNNNNHNNNNHTTSFQKKLRSFSLKGGAAGAGAATTLHDLDGSVTTTSGEHSGSHL